jgi:hypothetical protein
MIYCISNVKSDLNLSCIYTAVSIKVVPWQSGWMNFVAIPSKPFALVFDFSALLWDNLNWNSCIHMKNAQLKYTPTLFLIIINTRKNITICQQDVFALPGLEFPWNQSTAMAFKIAVERNSCLRWFWQFPRHFSNYCNKTLILLLLWIFDTLETCLRISLVFFF